MNIRLSLLVAATLVPSVSAATVSDAGSITLDGATYGLWGIASPAPTQTCSGGWPAGQLAEQALAREGMAWSKLGMSHGYVVQEAQAASRFLGVHNHHCEQPEIWRSKNEQFQRNESNGSE